MSDGSKAIKSGDYDTAIGVYTKALNENPNSANAFYNRGLANQMKGFYDQAIYDYTKAIEMNPSIGAAYENRARAYFANKDYDKALEDVDQAKMLGYEVDEDFIDDLNKASGRVLVPENAEEYYNKAQEYQRSGNLDQAIDTYGKAIEKNPYYAEAYSKRAEVYFDKLDYGRAYEDMIRAKSMGYPIDFRLERKIKHHLRLDE